MCTVTNTAPPFVEWLVTTVGKIPWRKERQPTPVSLLENPMARGASWAAVQGAAKSWTGLSDKHFHFSNDDDVCEGSVVTPLFKALQVAFSGLIYKYPNFSTFFIGSWQHGAPSRSPRHLLKACWSP